VEHIDARVEHPDRVDADDLELDSIDVDGDYAFELERRRRRVPELRIRGVDADQRRAVLL
jgi:hypothetical protein